MTAAAEFDPYSDVRIERMHVLLSGLQSLADPSIIDLLAPLSAAADLPNHPTLSIPFTSKTLTELTRQAGEMVQKEKASLWRIKHLLTRLSGDSTWIPCETVETDNDFALFIDEREPAQPNILEKAIARANGDQVSTGTMVSEDTEHVDRPLLIEGRPEDATMGDASHTVKHLATDGGTLMGSPSHMSDTEKAPVATSGTSKGEETTEQLQHNGLEATLNDSMEVDGTLQTSADEPILDQVEQAAEVELIDGEGDDAEVPAPRRMRTRAQAQAASDNNTSRSRSASSDSESETFIHPYFLTPASSRHDRNIGLPQPEADETRRLLQLYIQKQEEVCRGAQKVHEGLLKADRYRKLVMKWAKAEAHVGLNRDLSDGEDWYDKEEWGLDEDLKKGQDEEEEDAATTAKKTRTRRQ